MKRIIAILLICLSIDGFAQQTYTSSGKPAGSLKKQRDRKDKSEGFDPTRMIYGGGLGFGMGNGSVAFGIQPVVGYRITDKFAAGLNFGYQFTKINDFFEITDANGFIQYYDFKANMFTTGVWARYLVLPQLFVHLGYEHNFLNFQNYRFSPSGSGEIEGFKENYDAPSVLVGIGYRQPIAPNVSMYFMGMVDVLQFLENPPLYSPYYYDKSQGILSAINPSIGFMIGF